MILSMYEKSWSELCKNRWKIIQRYSYLLHCVYDNKRFERCKNQYSLYLVFNKVKGYFEEIDGNK